MSDYTEVESQMNETKAKNIHSRAKLAEAEAAEKQAQAQKDEAEAKAIKAQGKKQRAKIKNAALSVGLAAVISGGAWLGYKSRKGVEDVVDGAAKIVNETGRAVETVARITKAANDSVEYATTQPDLAAYLIRAQRQKPNFLRPEGLLRAAQADRWSEVNSDFPISKEQFISLLKANERFLEENGRYMNNQEAIAARDELIKSVKGSLKQTLEQGSQKGTYPVQQKRQGR